jgi:hypothetical protein
MVIGLLACVVVWAIRRPLNGATAQTPDHLLTIFAYMGITLFNEAAINYLGWVYFTLLDNAGWQLIAGAVLAFLQMWWAMWIWESRPGI